MTKTIFKIDVAHLPTRSAEKEKDLALLYKLMPNLSDDKIVAIYFRYWEKLLIEDIAKILGLSWSEVDQLIESSIDELRHSFLMNQMSVQLEAA